MALTASSPPAAVAPQQTVPTPLRERHRRRRALARQDRVSARLAELHTVREVLVRAEALVATGWIQGGWFGYPTAGGPRVSHLPSGRTAASAASADRFCLVAAVHAATGTTPGPRLVRADRPVAERAVDTVWRTLTAAEPPRGRVPHLPSPEVRALRRIDLTRWNDAPGRTPAQVRGLLAAAAHLVETDRERLRSTC